ncbi:hypothetical protein SAMN04488118_102510 [Epibacterium ulvae]|uniref:Uncharacterized protein n=1 Tax=Epibacterium ulvae TaxID=1156985 RepID=A0A1G5Q274_9RHOB|nr:hypothetical protein [Epibacterium ulvae]SCZ55985.1 hypothetical protein SAMN04488118_102510 [Epibacterium ulvae]
MYKSSDALTDSLVFTLIILVLGLGIEFYSARTSILEKAGSNFTVEVLGDPKKANNQMDADILAARNVWNVYCGTSTMDESELYKKWLTQETSEKWIDIVGVTEYFSDRFRNIGFSEQQVATHNIFVLREFSHVINFIILEFPPDLQGIQRRNVVYFGWIANKESQQVIFRSSNAVVVELFKRQFENLQQITWNRTAQIEDKYEDGIEINHSYLSSNKTNLGPASLVDKSGFWETISFKISEGGDLEIINFAIVKIKFDHDNIKVDSQVYSPQGDSMNSFTSRSHDATYKLNNVYFLYKLRDTEETGLCH